MKDVTGGGEGEYYQQGEVDDDQPEDEKKVIYRRIKGVTFKILLPNQGTSYQVDLDFEGKTKNALFIVRNTDDNCLYAALFLSYVFKRDLKMRINNVDYEFNEHS